MPPKRQARDQTFRAAVTASSPQQGLERKSIKRESTQQAQWWPGWSCLVALLFGVICLQTAILFGLEVANLHTLLPSLRATHSYSTAGHGPELVSHGLAQGVFPKGCKWRDIHLKGSSKAFWAEQVYEYWHEEHGFWSREQPQSCRVQPKKAFAERPKWRNGSPRTQVECDDTHCLYQNLWYNNGKWFLLIGDGSMAVDWWQLSHNQELRVLHVHNSSTFTESIDYRIVEGDTLLLDYVFFLHPTAIGHWGEMIFPLFSILRDEKHFSVPPDNFLLLHLKRRHLTEWPRAVIAAALGLGQEEALPKFIMQQEQDEALKQISQPVEGVLPHEWLCFEQVLVVQDVLSGGERSFLKQEDAQAFRAAIYRNHGLGAPRAKSKPPRLITFQRKRANRRIANEKQFIRLLQSFAEVRVVEFDSTTPFKEQLRVISETGVFVSVHTSNLANAQFLQPGSAVIEIIQRNWGWNGMDRTFKTHTEKMGDIHHFAWRARLRNQTIYIDPRDGERFGHWPSHLCTTEECVEAHTNVDVVVNLDEFRRLLQATLPLIFKGASIDEAALSWPDSEAGSGNAEGEPAPEA